MAGGKVVQQVVLTGAVSEIIFVIGGVVVVGFSDCA